ncbi:TPA: hypothetical protein NG565_001407 [Vibrio parahaemolyticus]|nr:hypothetical protein [Vibrio parahaemolyticus]
MEKYDSELIGKVRIPKMDALRLEEHFSRIRAFNLADQPPLIEIALSEIITSLSTIELHARNSVSTRDAEIDAASYISKLEFDEVDKQLGRLLSKKVAQQIPRHILEDLKIIDNIWANCKSKDKHSSRSKEDLIQGLIDQLSARQADISNKAKKTIDDISQLSDSVQANLKINAQAQDNQLKKLASNLTSQIETSASNAKIEIREEASKLRRELTEELTTYLETSLETKQNEINESTKRKADFLLENVRKEVSGLSGKVNEQIEEFVVLNRQLRQTYKHLASDALAVTSMNQADDEKKTADSLRGWGVAWLIVSIGLFLLTFDYDKLIDDNNVPQYTLILLRSFFLIVGIAPGFYLLRESARHRTDERRYRQKGIQLATIDGYFAEFEESERNNAKKDLSKHYFHAADHFVDSSSVDNVQSKYDKIFDKVVSSKKFN